MVFGQRVERVRRSGGIARQRAARDVHSRSRRKHRPDGTQGDGRPQLLDGWRMRFDYADGDPDKESAFYILKHTNCPAVLTENLFQDNREDVDYLLSDAGKQAIVRLHVKGIIDYLNSL